MVVREGDYLYRAGVQNVGVRGLRLVPVGGRVVFPLPLYIRIVGEDVLEVRYRPVVVREDILKILEKV